jgi:7-keto-8-aminopelargonate synthetase-like enzyme
LNLRYTAPGGILYSVGVSPANAAAALAAFRKLKHVTERVETLRNNAALFVSLAKDEGLNTGPSADSPVVPVVISSAKAATDPNTILLSRG